MEADLVVAAQSGNQRAFVELVTPHNRKIWNVCLRITGSFHDAEDAMQETLALAWRKIDRFHGNSAFGTWLYRIASNVSIEFVRRRKQHDSLDDDGYGSEVQLADDSAGDDFLHIESSDVNTALNSLPEKSREAFVLFHVAGLKVAEIADHQGDSLSATKVRVHRARKTLENMLDRHGNLKLVPES